MVFVWRRENWTSFRYLFCQEVMHAVPDTGKLCVCEVEGVVCVCECVCVCVCVRVCV